MPGCPNCGNENPLGRVFCGACGSKLDLRGLSSVEITDSARSRWIVRHWALVVAPIVVVVIAMIVLSFIPRTTPIGVEGTRIGAQRVGAALRAMMNVQKGQTLGKGLSEADINAYIHFNKKSALRGVESLTVDIGDGYVLVRLVGVLKSMDIGSFRFAPKVSYDIACVPSGGVLRVRRVRKGRLPLIGPARTSVVRKLHRMLSSQKEWAIAEIVSELRAENDQLWVDVSR